MELNSSDWLNELVQVQGKHGSTPKTNTEATSQSGPMVSLMALMQGVGFVGMEAGGAL